MMRVEQGSSGAVEQVPANAVRVLAKDIRPGDYVARSRTHIFHKVDEARLGPVAVTLYYAPQQSEWARLRGEPPRRQHDRPGQLQKWWKLEDDES